jgi:long-chain fatty acid transport protein
LCFACTGNYETFLAWQVRPDWLMLASIGWQDWSEFGAVGVEIDSANPQSFSVEREYKDIWYLSLGLQHRINARLRWNADIGYDSSAVDDRDRTLDNPMNETWRLATGFNYWPGDMEVDQQRRSTDVRTFGEYSNTALHIIAGGVVWRF